MGIYRTSTAIVILALAVACAAHHQRAATRTALSTSPDAGTPVIDTGVEACASPDGGVADLSVKVAAAFAAGAASVSCSGGGEFATQLVVPAGRALHFGLGRFTLLTSPAILWRDHVEISGTGDGTVLLEPPASAGHVVLEAEADTVSHDGPGNSDVVIRDLQILGTGGPFRAGNGAFTAVTVGNSRRVSISRVTIRDTHAIGLEVGGTSNAFADPEGTVAVNNRAADIAVRDCTFDGVATVSLAVVNANGFVLSGNHFHRGGAAVGGLVNTIYIDIEPNVATDVVRGVVAGNDLHMEDAPANPLVGEPTIGGIAAQDGLGTTGYAVTIIDNTIVGGDGSTAHPCSDQIGIFLFGATGSEVLRNTVSWMCGEGIHVARGIAGIALNGGGGNIIGRNRVTTCGNWAIRVDTDGNHVFDNDVVGGTAGEAQVGGDPWIIEGDGANDNRIVGNRLTTFTSWWGATTRPMVTLRGSRSTQVSNVFDGASAP